MRLFVQMVKLFLLSAFFPEKKSKKKKNFPPNHLKKEKRIFISPGSPPFTIPFPPFMARFHDSNPVISQHPD
jgi:hypothetical protein